MFGRVLGDRHFFGQAEDGTGGGKHEPADARLHAGFEQVDAVGDVVAEIFSRIQHAFRHQRVAGEMHQCLGPDVLHRLEQKRAVGEIALDEFRPAVERLAMAFAEIVQHVHLVMRVQQHLHANAADVTRPASHEDFHRALMLPDHPTASKILVNRISNLILLLF